ncbi:MAG: hypothetical protein DKM50_07870 [Candidatus Margulisiibacteriota bacterium]|nr:MAG: hypothetical protein A2X43_07490 [Candidatus Margulisbacteria bacterium GWD2_39_127]PZM79675.1 MAG: hypothetical protein DKM50_07870 [Candidatus Margulisiibacteriota bacterium]HAR61932.1 hypothetical protein [Candidatus Margulisiibacteriota bacterium]HCY35711.1 hypothetical protein [Candidatus Margulisiibacteriota bacterium]
MKSPRLIIVATVLCLFLASFVHAKDELSEKKKELESIYTQLEAQRKKLSSTKIKEQNVLQEISFIRTKIRKSTDKLNYAEFMTQKRTIELKQISSDLIESEYNLAAMLKNFRGRLKEIYQTQDVSWLELLLSSNNFIDIINEFYYFEKLIKRDIILIDDIKEEKDKIESSKHQLEVKKKDIENQAVVIRQAKLALEQNKVDKEKLKASLAQQRSQYEQEINELEKNSRQIESLIRRMAAKATGPKIASTGVFVWPVEGWISSPYGYRVHPIFKTTKFHSGIDIAAPMGKPIQAVDSGVVIFSGKWGGYGKATIVDHGRGYSTVYAHQSRLLVNEGQKVDKGQIIGLVGSTGFSTGPHLHFEVRINGSTDNPMKYLPQK